MMPALRPLLLAVLLAASFGVSAARPMPQAAHPFRVAIVLYDDVELLEIVAPARILDAVPGFSVYTVAATHELVGSDLATIVPDYTYADAPAPDVIVVASGGGSLRDRALAEWLRKYARSAEAVMSVCNGALVLANAGLLDGRAATCPTGNLDGLMVLGKDVRAMKGRRFVVDGNVITCDSYFAGVDGALEVVRRLAGEGAARDSARANRYDWRPELFAAAEPQEPMPPSHDVAVLQDVLANGVDAALASYREWEASGARSRLAAVRSDRGRFPFHILGWTLESAGRTDDALALCQWTAAAFPESALALSCLGEAYFECGRFEEAFAPLFEADEKEPGESRALETLVKILHHPDFVASADSKRARQILRERAADSSATLVPPNEPGERLLIRGTVRGASGRPIPGARIHVFQTDMTGHYTRTIGDGRTNGDERESRLFAWLRADDQGRYELRTIRPGNYAVGSAPQHIHYEVDAPGYEVARLRLLFRDDPQLDAEVKDGFTAHGEPVIELGRDGAGTLRGIFDVTLKSQK